MSLKRWILIIIVVVRLKKREGGISKSTLEDTNVSPIDNHIRGNGIYNREGF